VTLVYGSLNACGKQKDTHLRRPISSKDGGGGRGFMKFPLMFTKSHPQRKPEPRGVVPPTVAPQVQRWAGEAASGTRSFHETFHPSPQLGSLQADVAAVP
jgi:hypothetical protein